MKQKLFFLMLATFTLAACNDECDHIIPIGPEPDNLNEYLSQKDTGFDGWYEEEENEEVRYSQSGTFYDKYTNKQRAFETEGRFETNAQTMKMIYYYKFMGQDLVADWTIKDRLDFSFTLSSETVADHVYEAIVKTHKMTVGEEVPIGFDSGISDLLPQYVGSTNKYIASVSDGKITANGEKGTAYLKFYTVWGNIWVKVIVGDDMLDLWIDYSVMLGQGYAAMKDAFGPTAQSEDFGDYTSYSYITSIHDVLDYVNFYVDNDSHVINQIDIHIKEGVTNEEILAYMGAHYYPVEGDFGKRYHFSTSALLENSRAIYVYDTERKAIILVGMDEYIDAMYCPWPDYTGNFGRNQSELSEAMKKIGYTFLQSMYSYASDGSDAYNTTGSSYVWAVEFVYNPDKVVSQYWIYLSSSLDQLAVLDYLDRRFVFATDEYVEGYGFVYYNKDKTQKVVYDSYNNAVIYTDLTMKAVDILLLRDYWKGLGMTKKEIRSTWGAPYTEDASGNMAYVAMTEYVAYTIFFPYEGIGKIHLVNVYLRDRWKTEPEIIKAYLNKLYTFAEETTSENGPLLRWYDAKTENEATMRISFYPDYGVIAYKTLKEEDLVDPNEEGLIPDYSLIINLTASRVKAKMGDPDRELAGAYIYNLSNHEYIKRTSVRFDSNPVTDQSLVTSVSVTLNDNHNQEKLLEFLRSTYLTASAYTTDTEYGFYSVDGSVLLQYTPSANRINYLPSVGF